MTDRNIRIATLVVLLLILYILLPTSRRYEYRIENSYGLGRFDLKPGEEPIAIDGSHLVVRRRKW